MDRKIGHDYRRCNAHNSGAADRERVVRLVVFYKYFFAGVFHPLLVHSDAGSRAEPEAATHRSATRKEIP